MDWIIGIGNRLRMDDGLGPRLAQSVESSAGVSVLEVQQLTPELSLKIRDADRVLFVDADAKNERMRMRRLAGRVHRGVDHGLAPEALLELTERVYGTAPSGWLLSVPGFAYEVGEELSPQARAAWPRASRCLREWIGRRVTAADD
jgi:hydrogenase maturation protease